MIPKICLLAITIATVGCAAMRTSIQSSWRDHTFTGPPFRHLAVLALFDTQAESRSFEQSAAESLEAEGVAVAQGHQFLDSRRDYTQAEMENLLAQAEADGLLIFRLIAVDERQVYRPPTPYLGGIPPGVILGAPYYWYYYPHWNYYWFWRATRDVVRSPGYWTERTYVVVESSLYDNRTDRLVWTAKSETLDDARFDTLADSIIGAVSNQLFDEQLLAPQEAIAQVEPTPRASR